MGPGLLPLKRVSLVPNFGSDIVEPDVEDEEEDMDEDYVPH